MDEIASAFGHWLANELDKMDWQQADLADTLRVKPGVVSSWINGKRRPSYESCLEISRALQIDPDVVVARAGRETTTAVRQRPRSPVDEIRAAMQRLPRAIPHHSQLVSAGKGEPMIDGYVYLDEDDRVGPNDFALTVTGTCMEPEISPGDRVVVDPDRIPETGNLIVFTLDDEQIMVKRLVWKEGKRWLEPRNGLPILYDERVVRTGVVRRVIKRY